MNLLVIAAGAGVLYLIACYTYGNSYGFYDYYDCLGNVL